MNTLVKTVLVDNQTVCECHDIASAICALFSCYYIFDIAYAPTCQPKQPIRLRQPTRQPIRLPSLLKLILALSRLAARTAGQRAHIGCSLVFGAYFEFSLI